MKLQTVVVSLLSVTCVANEPKLRKIIFEETDNYLFPEAPQFIRPKDSIGESPSLSQLKNYVLQRAPLRASADPDVIFEALEWVSTQWKHDGMNEPPKGSSALDILKAVHEKKARYRCVEYGLVLADILRSFGFVTRKVVLRSPEAPYGSFGQGHVATEVWSNSLRKWIFVDPQFSMYPLLKGKHLSFYDLYLLKKEGRLKNVEFRFTKTFAERNSLNEVQAATDYLAFIEQYFGYMAVPPDSLAEQSLLILPLEGKMPFLTFQGHPVNNAVFTQRVEDLYPEPNRTLIRLEFRNEAFAQKTPFEKLKIENDEEYLKQMPLFSPSGKLKAKLTTNTVGHAYYEYRHAPGAPWKTLKGDTLNWDLVEGSNFLEARSVHREGLPGVPTYLKLGYR